MGQKTNPIGQRLGYIRGWDSNWFASKKDFSEKLIEDHRIRTYITARLSKAAIAKLVIERTIKSITISIHTAKPGIIIGKGGAEVEKIRGELKTITCKEVQLNVLEVKKPDLSAKLVAESIAQQLQARISYRRAMKQAIASTMRGGALGVKVRVSGRLGGAEIARSERYSEGQVPLHTLRADIDYAVSEASTVYGSIGVKVWIYKGQIYQRPSLAPNAEVRSNEPSRLRKQEPRRFRNAT